MERNDAVAQRTVRAAGAGIEQSDTAAHLIVRAVRMAEQRNPRPLQFCLAAECIQVMLDIEQVAMRKKHTHTAEFDGQALFCAEAKVAVACNVIILWLIKRSRQILRIAEMVTKVDHNVRLFTLYRVAHEAETAVRIRQDKRFHHIVTFSGCHAYTACRTMEWRQNMDRQSGGPLPFSFSQDQIRRVLETNEGRQLLAYLMRDGGNALRDAAAAMKRGDEAAAQAAIRPMLQSQTVQDLLRQISEGR